MGCDLDLSTLDPSTPKGTLTWHICPVSCGKCPTGTLVDTSTEKPEKPEALPPPQDPPQYSVYNPPVMGGADTTEISEFFKPQHSRVYDMLDYTVHWTVEGDDLHLGIESVTPGWVGFGFAEIASGSMPGADILMGYVTSTGDAVVKDTHTTGLTSPVVDEVQDWKLLGGKKVNGKTYLAAKRKLDTKDKQDRVVLVRREISIIIAKGEMVNDQWVYHADRRLATKITLMPATVDPVLALKNDPDVKFVDFNFNHLMSGEETEYVDIYFSHEEKVPSFIGGSKCENNPNFANVAPLSCQDMAAQFGCDYAFPELGTLKQAGVCRKTCGQCPDVTVKDDFESVHLVGLEALVENGNEKFVHHFVVYGLDRDAKQSAFWAWAPGTMPFVAPSVCGFKLAPGSFSDIMLNVHYDNQDKKPRWDRSGVRLYYTTKQRQHDCGLMQIGDGSGTKFGDVIGDKPGFHKTVWECPADRFSRGVQGQKIRVFGSLLHMHLHGSRMWTTLKSTDSSGNEVSVDLNRNDYYDEAFQIMAPVDVVLGATDSLSTTCIHKLPNSKTKWGLASNEEMCIDFVYYYPAVSKLNYCGGSKNLVVNEHLASNEAFTFGKSGPNPSPSDLDPNGCIPSLGYSWCEVLGRCVSESVEPCSADTPPVIPQAVIPQAVIPLSAECVDDPTGDVKKAGASCGLLKVMGCDLDLSTLDPGTPKGTLTWHVCPVSCDKCAVAEEEESTAAPEEPSATSVEENGANVSCPKPQQFQVVSAQFKANCLDAGAKNGVLRLKKCATNAPTQAFAFKDGQLVHNEKCVQPNKAKLALGPCDKKAPSISNRNAYTHQFKFGQRCMNALTKAGVNLRKCTAKGNKMGFVVSPLV